MKVQRVLFPVDFSEPSARCLVQASKLLADSTLGDVHFLHVLRSPADFAAAEADVEAAIRKELAAAVARFEHDSPHQRHLAVVRGHPASVICDYARERACDLVVMATHGRSGLAHLLVGSTTEQVVRHAPCSVLALRSS